MRKVLRAVLFTLLGILGVIALCALVLVGLWVVRHEDPLAYLPEHPVAHVQVPSVRVIYDEWLNLPAADAVLGRPDLAVYRGTISDVRGLALTRSPVLRRLVDVHADVALLPDRKLLVVLDLGWRGILTPLARLVGPVLKLKGFSYLNDSGISLYRYTTGTVTIHAAFMENVVVVALDEQVVKDALARRAAGTGLAARASRDLLDRLKLRSSRAVRVVLDTPTLSSELLAGSDAGAAILSALQLPGQSVVEAEGHVDRFSLGASLPVAPGMPEVARVLGAAHSPLGVLRYVPASATLLTVSNLAPTGDLYRLAAAVLGAEVSDIYKKADDGARTVLGMGIDELVFSWAGAEVGAFTLPSSNSQVYFVKITDTGAYTRAMDKLTGSIAAGKDSSLVMDGVRVDRLTIPWYVGLILSALGVDAPEPYFVVRGDYFFLSMDAQNLAAVVKAGETGTNIARVGGAFARLTQGIPADPSALVWWDSSQGLPFFVSRTGTLADLLRVYGSGVAVVRVSPSELRVALVTESTPRGAAQPIAGFPLSVEGGVTGDPLAFRFSDGGPVLLAWMRDRSTLVLADTSGAKLAEARLDADSVILPEQAGPGVLNAIWAVSPGGTVWRFGPKLEPFPSFPVATGTASPMPPTLLKDSLALYSRTDSDLLLVGPDGSRHLLGAKFDSPLLAPPYFAGGRIASYPKSFDARVHLMDTSGRELPGWPVQAAGISFCSPRIVRSGDSVVVTFLTQAGVLGAWDESGVAVPSFPVTLPGVYYATPEAISSDGRTELVALSQDGLLSEIGMDGKVVRQTRVADLDGKVARIRVADLDGNGRQEILLYGSGAFMEGYDSALQPLPGFPVKGVTLPQLVDINRDGSTDLVSAGLDGKIYAYTVGRGSR